MKRFLLAVLIVIVIFSGIRLWMGKINDESRFSNNYTSKNMQTLFVGVDIPAEYKDRVDEKILEIIYPIIEKEIHFNNVTVYTPPMLQKEWEDFAKKNGKDLNDKSQMAVYVANVYHCMVLGINVMEYRVNNGKTTLYLDMIMVDPKTQSPVMWQGFYDFVESRDGTEKILHDIFRRVKKELGSK